MKVYEIMTRVAVYEEAATIAAANARQERDTGDETGIRAIAAALVELSHFGNPHHLRGPRGPLDCGVEVLRRDVQEVESCGTCERCRTPLVTLHVWQPEEGGEQHVCERCLLGLDEPAAPIAGFPVGRVPSPFPRSVAVEHAGELRQMLADLLEWGARTGMSYEGKIWREAKALMTRIRDEEDEAREAGQ